MVDNEHDRDDRDPCSNQYATSAGKQSGMELYPRQCRVDQKFGPSVLPIGPFLKSIPIAATA